jgi:hypothetical protein
MVDKRGCFGSLAADAKGWGLAGRRERVLMGGRSIALSIGVHAPAFQDLINRFYKELMVMNVRRWRAAYNSVILFAYSSSRRVHIVPSPP